MLSSSPTSREWQKLPPSPLSPRAPVAVVWTGREVIVWGGSTTASDGEDAGRRPTRRGAIPARSGARPDGRLTSSARSSTATITRIPPTRVQSLTPRESTPGACSRPFALSPQASAIAWTGKDLVAWRLRHEGGAYDPSSDAWRKLPTSRFASTSAIPKERQCAMSSSRGSAARARPSISLRAAGGGCPSRQARSSVRQ